MLYSNIHNIVQYVIVSSGFLIHQNIHETFHKQQRKNNLKFPEC